MEKTEPMSLNEQLDCLQETFDWNETEYIAIEALIQSALALPMGSSQWKAHGKKYGYDKYYGIKWNKS